MKYNLKKTFILLGLTTLALPTLAGCNNNPASSSANSSSVVSSTSSVALSSISSQATKIDYVNNGSVKLKMDYTNRTFEKDGIEKVELRTCIDGDTSHFSAKSGTIKIRYYGVDTPESTGKVQPYGKKASNFTKSKLKAAAENGTIVITAPDTKYTTPSFDSTGTRYLGLVWINETVKNAPYDTLVCLNLWIVQEGFSVYKSSTDANLSEYTPTFMAAEDQARKLKLNYLSGEEDDGFNYGAYEEVSLLDLKREVVANLNDSSHANAYDGANVKVQGTVVGYCDNILYLQGIFDEEHGAEKGKTEYAGINIFCGMTAISSNYTKVGTYLEVPAVASDSENFGFQLAGAEFSKYAADEKKVNIIYTAAENDVYPPHVFEYTVDQLDALVTNKDYGPLYSPIKVTEEVYCYDAFKSDSGDVTLYLKKQNADGSITKFRAYVPFTYKPDAANQPTWSFSTAEEFENRRYNITGIYSCHKVTNSDGSVKRLDMQLIPRGSQDLVCLDLD